MDFRNEYRVRPEGEWFNAEFRRWWSRKWIRIDYFRSIEDAERSCRQHSGADDKLLGRLP